MINLHFEWNPTATAPIRPDLNNIIILLCTFIQPTISALSLTPDIFPHENNSDIVFHRKLGLIGLEFYLLLSFFTAMKIVWCFYNCATIHSR